MTVFALFGLCNCYAIGCIVVIFVTVVTPHFGLLFPTATPTVLLTTGFLLSTGDVGAISLVRLSFSRFSSRLN
jgi:hypothetical protein